MQLLLAMMKHETNTFSPVPTDLARFARGRATPLEGEEIRAAFRGTGTGIGRDDFGTGGKRVSRGDRIASDAAHRAPGATQSLDDEPPDPAGGAKGDDHRLAHPRESIQAAMTSTVSRNFSGCPCR